MAKTKAGAESRIEAASMNGTAGLWRLESGSCAEQATVKPARVSNDSSRNHGNFLALLSDSEREVMLMYASLQCAKEVARKVGFSLQAVRRQLASIERKLSQADLQPRWDKKSRKLSFGGFLVHRFRRPAPIVEMILDAFAEEGWAEHIDDPLPPLAGRRQSDRLRKEIYALNRRLEFPLIRFSLDGTGGGICWEQSARGLTQPKTS